MKKYFLLIFGILIIIILILIFTSNMNITSFLKNDVISRKIVDSLNIKKDEVAEITKENDKIEQLKIPSKSHPKKIDKQNKEVKDNLATLEKETKKPSAKNEKRLPPPNNSKGNVMRVIDGDTAEIFVDGFLYVVRYLMIDTPELHSKFKDVEPFAKEACEFNKRLVEGKTVILEKDKTEFDKYGRLLRYVYLDSIMINLELIRCGLAEILFIKPDVKHYSLFAEIQSDAQEKKLGIWSIREFPKEKHIKKEKDDSDTLNAKKKYEQKMKNLQKLNEPKIVISKIFFDGIVPRVESDEYIEIKNNGEIDVCLQGWQINAGNSKQNFVFAEDFILAAGKSCRIYTNEIHPESGGFSFKSKRAIWKNSGDIGYLIDNKNQLADKWKY
ncbi:MAG: thermonuclease family protein [Candidatus Cloacimonetes bacterium]|nr:thermonuclease family protein [Candidatus Cloacimonadota bacterium]MCF7815389.1 thermonuclease family protein [Candidatus Cloacimonadota bacterium]MCF7869479.1 thermonuclease family protein [Candidatus Cloacimonadota bacterium]MCF7883149.1 thermonuclease family protein [Candidatus Cloacimonadota bacterium]